ncbi:farnesol dehydrogenase [Contarinia nasturtii]|uniref:farnesol dehydrogenase n=1 Tax=Contarinia nasturtii TaxID=265458 RepID=UPI0012D4B97A|nr:farnesol dehydrogenase [Contarinia nasturtii]
MDKWKGKVALVSGSSTGIGANITKALANSGLTVIGLGRRVEAIQDLTNQIQSGKIIAKKCDVTNETEVLEVFKWIKDTFGHLNVFVNNAGVIKSDLLLESKTEDFKSTFDVNVISACVCIRESVKLIKANGSFGHIIVINSVLGHRIPDLPVPLFNVYPASKFALTAITQTVRQELAFQQANIKLTSISPGMVNTEFLTAYDSSFCAGLPRLKCDDVTAAVLYALSTSEQTQVEEVILQAVPEYC